MNKRQRKKYFKKLRAHPLGAIQYEVNRITNEILRGQKGLKPGREY